MSGEFEVMEPDEDGWSDWIHPLPGYLMKCCDCGLVHEMETAIVPSHEDATPTAEGEDKDHIIVFRMRRPASAIEARRAETQGGSVEDESAVPNGETPKGH